MRYTTKQYAEALYQTLVETKPDGHDRVIENFVQILKRNGDLEYYEAVIAEYEALDRQMRNIKQVEVTVAHDEDLNKTVIQQLNDFVDGDIELKKKVDESIIGGIVVKVEDTLIDASVKGQLGKLKTKLTN